MISREEEQNFAVLNIKYLNCRQQTEPVMPLIYNVQNRCLLKIYVRRTSKIILGCEQTCESVRSWQLYSDARLGDHSTMLALLQNIPLSDII